jgi:hypothetical protein
MGFFFHWRNVPLADLIRPIRLRRKIAMSSSQQKRVELDNPIKMTENMNGKMTEFFGFHRSMGFIVRGWCLTPGWCPRIIGEMA